jgi:hypothetical protein
MKVVDSPETLPTYQTTRRRIPEYGNFNILHRKNLRF